MNVKELIELLSSSSVYNFEETVYVETPMGDIYNIDELNENYTDDCERTLLITTKEY